MRALVIYGPHFSGKSHYARRLARFYKLREIVDPWDGRKETLVDEGLHIIVRLPLRLPEGVYAVNFWKAKRLYQQWRREFLEGDQA